MNINATTLPSGLGAGGRGKEKAPCRYLHFEVDYDGLPGEGGMAGSTMPVSSGSQSQSLDDIPRLNVGTGPSGQISKTLVRALNSPLLNHFCRDSDLSFLSLP